MVNDQRKTADQYAQVCAMSLSRCQLQFAAATEFFPQVDILPGYERILADVEHFVCDGAIITNDMLQGYVDWCLEIKRVCEYTHIDYLSPWRKQFLPDAIQSLGEAFSNWMCSEMYREAIFVSDTRAFIKLGIDIVSCYEYSRFSIHPSNFHYFTFLRSRHSDIEDIMQKRETLRAFMASRERQTTDEPDEEFEEAHKEFMRLGNLLHDEGRKYWGEALAEHKRLKAEYRPPASEDLVLTMRELERIRADVQFVTTENRTKEDIRQRLQYYRTLDIASLDSSFLVGYGALHNLISCYSSLAVLSQCMEGDIVKCKEYLYLAAYCQRCICQWTNQEKAHSSTDFVSLAHLGEFYMGIIADADVEFIRNLGELLCLPERNWNDFLIYRGNAAISLALGNTKDAIYYAEKMKEEELKKKPNSKLWLNYAHCICAIATGDTDAVNEDICSIISSWRRTSGPPRLLIFHALGLAKIAVQHGIDITIDTMDCPQVLIQPAKVDYSHLNLPRPKYGFPWEK